MIRITGNTFPYKEQIKRLGGTWDGDAKCWMFYAGADVSSLHGLPGLHIFGDVKPEAPAPRREPVKIDFAKLFADAERDRPKPGEREPNVYGNDQTYLNAFSGKNPAMFAGFRSFSDMIDYVEQTPRDIVHDDQFGRNVGWETTNGKWAGTADMPSAIHLARNGWNKGTELALEAAEIIDGDHAVQRIRSYNVAGGRVNVGRLLSGNPLHMQHRPRQEGKKVITLFSQIWMAAAITPENAIIRAASIAAMSDVLAANGYSCEIVAVGTNRTDGGQPGADIAVTIKEAGEPLNIENVVFALGHPSMLRRFCFALCARETRLRQFWRGMGSQRPAFADPDDLSPSSFYIGKLEMSDQNQVEGDTFKDRVRSLFPLIVPDGFPVELSS